MANDRDHDSGDDSAIRLGFYLHDTSRLRKLVYDAAFRPAGITRAQAWVLSYLVGEAGINQSALADRLDLGKVALGSLVDKLENAALVRRTPDPDDRRAKRVMLTGKGRRTLGRLRELGASANDQVLQGISARDVEITTKTLLIMKKNLLDILSDDG